LNDRAATPRTSPGAQTRPATRRSPHHITPVTCRNVLLAALREAPAADPLAALARYAEAGRTP